MYISDLYQSVFLPIREPGTDLIHHCIKPGDTVFDIGANIGRFTTLAAGLTGRGGRVYSFEPLSYPAGILSRMLAMRRLRQVTLVRTALADRVGSVTMTIPLKHGWKPKTALGHLGAARKNEPDVVMEEVTVTTLDIFCREQEINRVDFIKCDVEGAELRVFQNGSATLASFKPTIFCEIDRQFNPGNNFAVTEVFDLLARLGYKAYLPRNDEYLYPVSGLDLERDRAEFFFIHRDRASACRDIFAAG